MDFKYIIKYEDERLEFVKDLKELSVKLYYEESYLKSRIGFACFAKLIILKYSNGYTLR